MLATAHAPSRPSTTHLQSSGGGSGGAKSSSCITLKGSAQIVTEFFDFKMVKKYGMNLLVTTNEDGLQSYLRQILTQVQ
ncbi:hypothetical protein HK405_013244, partial [Cladochytrium tenue]